MDAVLCEEQIQPSFDATKITDSVTSAAAQIYATMEPEEEATQGFGSPAATPVPNKQLDFDVVKKADTTTPSTPITTPLSTKATSGVEEAEVDYNAFVKDTLLWTHTVRSAFYLVSGTILLLTVDYMLGHNIPMLNVIAYLTLSQMALNFLRHAISPQLQQKATWLDSAWTAAAISQLASSIKALAAIHDKHLSASNPHKHLIIAASLWMMSLLSRVIAPMHLALVLYIGLFAVPKAYVTFKSKIDPVAKDIWKQGKSKFDSLDHRAKAGVTMVLIMALGCVSTVDLVIAGFVVCVFAHSQLPKEVEQVGKRIAPVVTPLGTTASKIGSKMSSMLIDTSNKFELTPTPLKQKKTQ